MKKNLFKFSILLSVLLFSSCSNDDNSSSDNDINGMKAISFEMKADKEISAKATGNTAVINGEAKKEYSVTTEKSDMVDVPSLSRESGIESTLLYPGSILRGSSFINGVYDPLILKNSFKPVNLFLTIKSNGLNGSIQVNPTGSSVNNGISTLLGNYKDKFSVEYIPANYSYESTEINNEESFIKASKVHAKANYSILASASFGYSNSQNTVEKKKYVLVKLNQTIYSAGIDPKYQTDWIEGSISKKEAGDYEPVYISSIDYGRAAYINIETDLSTKEAEKMVESSIKVGIGKIGGNIDYNYNENFKKLFSSNKVKVSIIGGDAKTIVTNYDSFIKYLSLGNDDSFLLTAAPISYTIRKLMNNTQVSIVNQYKDVQNIYR